MATDRCPYCDDPDCPGPKLPRDRRAPAPTRSETEGDR